MPRCFPQAEKALSTEQDTGSQFCEEWSRARTEFGIDYGVIVCAMRHEK